MEKDLGRISKNAETDIIIRIDDFGGKVGLTIREFVKSERYSGFTKAGTRIPADKIKEFKAIVNSIDEKELAEAASMVSESAISKPSAPKPQFSGSAPSSSKATSKSKDVKPVKKKDSGEEVDDMAF